uniref:Variant surface glycoprotein 1484 n=1 Tax=Trypanosoma brucei TaxID=5691 RepID=M4SVI3_9TRYP|nr:variant surface glycoprotein 1484 [Trypanosoma brucei]
MFPETIVALLTLLVLSVIDKGNPTAGEYKNQKHLHNLCQLVALTKATLETVDTTEIPTTTLDELERINMYLAHSIFKEKLPTKAAEKKYGSAYCQTPGEKEECKDYNGRWQDLYISMHDNGKLKDIYAIPKNKRRTSEATSASLQIQLLLKQAQDIRQGYNNALKTALPKDGSSVQRLIYEAIYGAAKTTDLSAKDCNVKLSNSRATDCHGAAGKAAVCTRLICLCANDDTQDKALCGETASSSATTSAWSDTQKGANWNKISSVCAAYQPQPLSPRTLRRLLDTAVRATTAVSGGGADHLILGTASSTGSCGTESDVGCIQLSDTRAISPAAPATATITWATKIETAADLLETTNRLAKAKHAAESAMTQMTNGGTQLVNALRQSIS